MSNTIIVLVFSELPSFVRMILQREENKGVELTGDGERKLEGKNEKSEAEEKAGRAEARLYTTTSEEVHVSPESSSGVGLSVWEPAPEGSPYHVRAEGTVGLYFVKAAAALSVGRSATAEESMTTFIQSPTLVIGRAALACAAGRIAGHPPVDRRREKAQSERD